MEVSAAANWFAYIALLAWPLVAVFLYRNLPPSRATVWTILGALLLLPSQFAIKIPMIPAIDKSSISALSAVAGCFLFAPRLRRFAPRFGLAELLAATYIFGPVITSLLNNDVIVIGDRVLPGVGWYDGISALLSQTILFLPFFVGRRFLHKAEHVEIVLRTLALGGLLYSLPMLFEVRFSPQLSNWIYGYFPSSFTGESRYEGFRPVVFLNNGLTAAFFMSTAFLAAVALWRVSSRFGKLPTGGILSYLGVVLILCKSAGSLMYGIVFGFLIRWTKPTTQVRVAIVVASIALLYPVLRVTNYFPTNQLVDLSATFSQERADSLKFRFDQEQQLLARASERFFFGWGRYGRNRVYEEGGNDLSVTDGLWISTLGTFGITGFVALFGLLTLSVFRVRNVINYVKSSREKALLSSLTVIVALTAIEQLPNASITPWNWLLAGVLLGRVEQLGPVSRRKTRVQTFTSEGPVALEGAVQSALSNSFDGAPNGWRRNQRMPNLLRAARFFPFNSKVGTLRV
jgi:hypothetical protein